MKTVHNVETAHNATIASTTAIALDTLRAKRMSVHVVYSNGAPAAGTFTAAVTDICTKAAHGYVLGLKVQLTTTTTLPAGLSLATDYFVIPLTADTFSLATSLALAVAGTAVNVTDTGTGTHTITPTTSTSNVCKLQCSNDNTNWVDVASQTVTISTSASSVMFLLDAGNVVSKYYRCLYTPSAGQIALAIYCNTLTLP